MQSHRILTLCPDDAPLWVTLYLQPVEDRWAAMIVADGALPPGPDAVKGTAFFRATAEEAEQLAHAYLMGEAANQRRVRLPRDAGVLKRAGASEVWPRN